MTNLHISNIHDLSDKTLCPQEAGFPQKACLDRSCPNCGLDTLDDWYTPLVTQDGDVSLDFDRWKNVEVERLIMKEGESQKVKSKPLRLVTSSCTVIDIVSAVRSEMEQLTAHLFRAAWQQRQYSQGKKNMPAKSALLVTDFAENYTCAMQDEVQSYHWTQTQVTVHPVMAYVNASSDVSVDPTHTEALFFISDDLKHDAAAVEKFMEVAFAELKQKYDVQTVVQFSDCCAAQYRGKTSFADMSFAKKDHAINLSRQYFESGHGKSAADGLGAIAKQAATMAVTRRQVKIRDAEEFYYFCTSSLQQVGNSVFQSRVDAYQNASRSFFFIQSPHIKRVRPDREVASVKGTMKIHAVQPTGAPYHITVRGLSCFCNHRRYGKGLCENVELVGDWQPVTLQPSAVPSERESILCI